MKKFFTLIAVLIAACGSLFAQEADKTWYMVGLINEWKFEAGTWFTSKGDGVYELKLDEYKGDFKILRADAAGKLSWSLAWGTKDATKKVEVNGAAYTAEFGGNNVFPTKDNVVWKNATVTLTEGANPDVDPVTITITGTEQSMQTSYGLVGVFCDWSLSKAEPFVDKGNGVWECAYTGEFTGEFKISKNGTWVAYGGTNQLIPTTVELGTALTLAKPADGLKNLKITDIVIDPVFSLTIADDETATLVVTGEKSGITDIEADDNAPIEYYNLQGLKIENPENGLFIKKQGNKVSKVLVK